jgi:hypothetical protein
LHVDSGRSPKERLPRREPIRRAQRWCRANVQQVSTAGRGHRGKDLQRWELEYRFSKTWELSMTIGTILLIVLVLILIGVIPTWPHSSGWGYYPAGGIGTILIIVLILLLLGRL